MPINEEKIQRVLSKNTFYFFNQEFETVYEGYLNALKDTLLLLHHDIKTYGLQKEHFEKLLAEKDNGLRALLALTGVSNETLKRLITLVRLVDEPELNALIYKNGWAKHTSTESFREWSDKQINHLIKNNHDFRKGVVNLFFAGSTLPFLVKIIPLFELKKLSVQKLQFDISELIDTVVRYKEKGSYAGKKANNPEILIERILDDLSIPFETGDLIALKSHAADIKRTMDFIIPNKTSPVIIIESSFLTTTSSGQGDKSKTEISIRDLIKIHYPKAHFIGFIDGIGWYVRKGDLQRMVSAYDDVFTFHTTELKRFHSFLSKTLI